MKLKKSTKISVSGSQKRMHLRTSTMRIQALCALVCCAMISLHHQMAQPAQASRHSYDPEQQDGIPVFSARSISKPFDDWEAADQPAAAADQQPHDAQRRQADSDLDDGMEDEDEDEYKSGSSPQESIENPSYGESSRAARDGDEIEDFFDKHLGPPQEATATDESSASVSHRELPAVDPDTDDHYETAASSPLSNIFHSLLSHSHGDQKHRRPFLQIGMGGGSSDSSSTSGGGGKEDAESMSTASKSTPIGASLKTSQSTQSFVETAPITLAFSPIAAPSQMVGQELQDQQVVAPALASSGVREIYIGRRPTVMNYLQQAYVQQQQQPLARPGYSTAGSSQVWRGAQGGREVVYEQDSQPDDYARYPIAASHAYQREQPNAAASATAPSSGGLDEQTVTYGLSFGGAHSADEGQSGAPPSDEAQDDHPSGSGVEATDSQQEPQAYQQQAGYVPYNTRYSASSIRAHNNRYNNVGQFDNGPYYRQAYVRATPLRQQQQQMMAPQQQPEYQQYSRGGSTRYHRDPSESVNDSASAMRSAISPQQQQPRQYYAGYQQVGATQYRGGTDNQGRGSDDDEAGETTNRVKAQQYAERQKLLASLDREIKASPHYRSNNAAAAASTTAQARMYASRAAPRPRDNRQHLVAIKTLRKSYKGDDLDSYNSFHSEVDPYKTFTSTSRMIDDPVSSLLSYKCQRPIQGGNDCVPATDANSDATSDNVNLANLSSTSHQFGNQRQQVNTHLLTGPLTNSEQSIGGSQTALHGQEDLLRNNYNINADNETRGQGSDQGANIPNTRVRREDSDEREIDNDVDDDGVWVDDDEDDDNRQQSSDVNETAQDPEGEEEDDNGQQDEANNVPMMHHQINPPGVIGGPHGYEIAPNDLMVYHG